MKLLSARRDRWYVLLSAVSLEWNPLIINSHPLSRIHFVTSTLRSSLEFNFRHFNRKLARCNQREGRTMLMSAHLNVKKKCFDKDESYWFPARGGDGNSFENKWIHLLCFAWESSWCEFDLFDRKILLHARHIPNNFLRWFMPNPLCDKEGTLGNCVDTVVDWYKISIDIICTWVFKSDLSRPISSTQFPNCSQERLNFEQHAIALWSIFGVRRKSFFVIETPVAQWLRMKSNKNELP